MIERQTSFTPEEILELTKGGTNRPPLPCKPFLGFHEISMISLEGGKFGKGYLLAHYNIDPQSHIFECHFRGNPLLPGWMMCDGLLQLGGFYLPYIGVRGEGMASSFGSGRFRRKVTPSDTRLDLRVDIKNVKLGAERSLVKFDGKIICGGEEAVAMMDCVVGVVGRS